MKITLMIALFLLLIGCSSDSNPEDGLPKETQTGANTFGCLIDGELLVPRSKNSTNDFGVYDPLNFLGSYDDNHNYNEIEVWDYKSNKTTVLLLHIQGLYANGAKDYVIQESNGMSNIDGYEHSYVHCTIFDKKTNSYQQYVSYENSGVIKISFYSAYARVSGIFNCRIRNIDNPSDEIEITNGRFDINGATLPNKYFP
jgi:hypothetical protein